MNENQAGSALDSVLKTIHEKFPNNFSYHQNFFLGESGNKTTQFNDDFLLIFNDELWVLKNSENYNSDRFKEYDLDNGHLKKILQSKSQKPIHSYLVVPNTLSTEQKREINNLKMNISNSNGKTNFDDILYAPSVKSMLENKCSLSLEQGDRSNILGDMGELTIVNAFANKNNLALWNNGEKISNITSPDFETFEKILLGLEVPRNQKIKQITKIETGVSGNPYFSEDLQKVKVGNKNFGKPKTDVYMELLTESNEKYKFKISVKRPTNQFSKSVTIHEGPVERLLADLQKSLPTDSPFKNKVEFNKLSDSLTNFQTSGNFRGMNASNKEYISNNLSQINRWMSDYFVYGINNSLLSEKQKANLLVVINPKTGKIHTTNPTQEYNFLIDKVKRSTGTPFSFTYPSKRRGKAIQVKAPIAFEQNRQLNLPKSISNYQKRL